MRVLRQENFLLPVVAVCSAFCLCAAAQEENRVDAPPVPAAPAEESKPEAVQAVPVATPTSPPQPSGFGPTMPQPARPVAMPPQSVTPAPNSVSPNSGKPKGLGPTISSLQSTARVVENVRPERVKVYPDDPFSAWWEINPHYAFERAQMEQKPLMLLFTGIWNTQSMALSEEVFSTKSFNEYVKENLIICYLNFPRNITDAHPKLREIKDKFKVRGYPNVLIFNPNGEVEKGIRGYRTGRPVDYFNQLKLACNPVLASIEQQKAELLKLGYRKWTNDFGKEIFARFDKRNEEQLILLDVSGQDWVMDIRDLSLDDEKFVESFPIWEPPATEQNEP